MTTTQTAETPLPEEIANAIEAYGIRSFNAAIEDGHRGETAGARAALETAIRKALPQPPGAVDAVRALEFVKRIQRFAKDADACDAVSAATAITYIERNAEALAALLASTPPPVLEPEHEGRLDGTIYRHCPLCGLPTKNARPHSLLSPAAPEDPPALVAPTHADATEDMLSESLRDPVQARAIVNELTRLAADGYEDGVKDALRGHAPADLVTKYAPPPAPEGRQEAGPAARRCGLCGNPNPGASDPCDPCARATVGLPQAAEGVPPALYLERWPEEADRDDTIFYEPTGYGDDLRGNTSTIYEYRLAVPSSPSSTGSQEGGERPRCDGDCDIALARRQFPDGTVPGNTKECAEGWERWFASLHHAVRLHATDVDRLRIEGEAFSHEERLRADDQARRASGGGK